jgi:ribonuclease T2
MPTIHTRRRISKLLLLLAVVVFTAHAAKRRGGGSSSRGAFDYYLLSLSWAPDFCALPNGNKDPRECSPGRRLGFVVHGLWPQAETGRAAENCGAPPVSAAIVDLMLHYIPTPGLIQHEWSEHGSCTGLSAADYFALVRQARDKVRVPVDLAAPSQDRTMAPRDIAAEFAAANPAFPPSAFRVTCVRGDLQEVRACFTKDLAPRACSGTAGQCPVPAIQVRHPQ